MKQPKLKPCANKTCSKDFLQYNSTVKVCSTKCAIEYAKDKNQAKATKEWKREKSVRKAKLETVQDLMKKAQREFNTFIRLRDQGGECISCGTKLEGKYDAGHFVSSGKCKSLTFNERNVWAQCVYCNQHQHGNLLEYRKGLIKKIGIVWVQHLEMRSNETRKYTREELRHLINFYKQKVKELKDN